MLLFSADLNEQDVKQVEHLVDELRVRKTEGASCSSFFPAFLRYINFRNLKYCVDRVLGAIASCLFNEENERRGTAAGSFTGYRLRELSLF